MNNMETVNIDLEKFQDSTVLCVGDIMLDRFVYGEVNRISPEAPVPICLVSDENSMLGGAGNVIRNLAALGVTANYIGVVGDDDAGKLVQSLLNKLSSISSMFIVDETRSTTVKERVISGSQHLIRVDREVSAPLGNEIDKKFRNAVAKAIPNYKVLVLSDYGKGTLSRDTVAFFIDLAQRQNVPVIVDPKGPNYCVYAGAYLITPNIMELGLASHLPTDTDGAIAVAAEHLRKTCRLENVLVTRSSRGMTLVEPGRVSHFDTHAREVFDVSGAGDTVVAALAASVSAGLSLKKAVRLSNIAAGIVVGKIGTAVTWRSDIAEVLFKGHNFSSGASKLVTADEAVNIVKRWRQNGDRIGFTNGCFDIIHAGHTRMLSSSRAICDRLIVGLNSDSSVKRLKGDRRPINRESARAAVLGAFYSVDLIVIFDEDTPLDLIKIILPDLLTKGSDYELSDVVGLDVLKKYNGEVKLIDIEKGYSTSDILAKISGKFN